MMKTTYIYLNTIVIFHRFHSKTCQIKMYVLVKPKQITNYKHTPFSFNIDNIIGNIDSNFPINGR